MIKQIKSNQLTEYIKNKTNCILLDVRTQEEWKQDGMPDGDKIGIKTYFLTIKDENFANEFKKLNVSQEKEVLVMCMGGVRSQAASQLLSNENYNCVNISDGFLGNGQDVGWKNNLLPVKLIR